VATINGFVLFLLLWLLFAQKVLFLGSEIVHVALSNNKIATLIYLIYNHQRLRGGADMCTKKFPLVLMGG
jgi:hypothetical protein